VGVRVVVVAAGVVVVLVAIVVVSLFDGTAATQTNSRHMGVE
jgi:hypothetical protein